MSELFPDPEDFFVTPPIKTDCESKLLDNQNIPVIQATQSSVFEKENGAHKYLSSVTPSIPR
jgi:hypothetical protein